jgi:hypothetical protein
MSSTLDRINKAISHMTSQGIEPQRVDLTEAAYQQVIKERDGSAANLLADGWLEKVAGLDFNVMPDLTYSAVVGNGPHGRVHVMV